MPKPLSDIDELFARMAVAYGHRFMSLYDGLNLEHVKADWAIVLDGATPEMIDYGMANLPAGRPPDARMFREVCMRMPDRVQRFLPDMTPKKGMPDFARKVLDRLESPHEKPEPERIRNARYVIELFGSDGQVLSVIQRQRLEAARKTVKDFDDGRRADAELKARKAEAQARTDARLSEGAQP